MEAGSSETHSTMDKREREDWKNKGRVLLEGVEWIHWDVMLRLARLKVSKSCGVVGEEYLDRMEKVRLVVEESECGDCEGSFR